MDNLASPPQGRVGLSEQEASPGPRGSTHKALRSVIAWFAILFDCGFYGCYRLLQEVPSLLFVALTLLFYWGCVAALIAWLYLRSQKYGPESGRATRFAARWQWLLLLAAAAAIAKLLYPDAFFLGPLNELNPGSMRFSAIALLTGACGLFFFANYASALQKRLAAPANTPSDSMPGAGPAIAPLVYLSWVVIFACGASAAVLFLRFSAHADYSPLLGYLLLSVAGVLAAEPWARFAARFYLPRSLRKLPAPVGTSLLLSRIFGAGIGKPGFFQELERLARVKFRDIWIFNFVRRTITPALLAAFLVGWLSTCLTSVPLGSRGVLISFGRYRTPVLPPGLHLILPWPFQEVACVETERTREFTLGLDKGLSGAVLWVEKHAEGEKYLLIDNGEVLLAVNIPIFYRISDAVTYLKTAKDAEAVVKSLAQRKLIQIAASRESFRFMTEDRQAIADTLKEGLQAEADSLNLGLEITYVGLKDIHPPLDVAAAYQKVISAQEQKEALIDDALAEEARTIPLAKAHALDLVVSASAAYTARVDQSTGEAGRFETTLASEKEYPLLFRLRLKYDMLDEILPNATKTIVGIPSQTPAEYYLDLRPGAAQASPRNR